MNAASESGVNQCAFRTAVGLNASNAPESSKALRRGVTSRHSNMPAPTVAVLSTTVTMRAAISSEPSRITPAPLTSMIGRGIVETEWYQPKRRPSSNHAPMTAP